VSTKACAGSAAASPTDFCYRVSDYVKAQKGQFRGLQSGVLALAALVAPKVDDAAKQAASEPFRLGAGGFAAMVQPAVVDLTEGRVHTLPGPAAVGCGVRRLPAGQERPLPAGPGVSGTGGCRGRAAVTAHR
jgi:hypothetical protein